MGNRLQFHLVDIGSLDHIAPLRFDPISATVSPAWQQHLAIPQLALSMSKNNCHS